MAPEELRIVDGAAAGSWIEPELSGGGSVGGNVPDRFDAYVRVLHPPSDRQGERVTWAQVADELGRQVHPLAQWDAIVGANRYRNERPDWPGNGPETGSLEGEVLGRVTEILAAHTTTPEATFFALWAGMSWGTTFAFPAGDSEPPPRTSRSTDDLSFAFPAEQVPEPRLQMPQREYVVLSGPLAAATSIEDWLSPLSPNLIWPEDRAWFLATEIDFDSTLIGGTGELAEAILGDPGIEAFPVGPRDLLTWNADKVNPPLPR